MTRPGGIKKSMSHTAQTEKAKLLELDSYLSSKIIGQSHVIPRVSSVLRRGQLGITDPHRPKGSFLFLGPTGVGKTEITKAFTSYLLGNPEQVMARFDMSEFQNQSSLGILIGQNNSETGVIGKRLSSGKIKVILFDEIEKAHTLILDILLQILDAGRITLANGETQDLTDKYIVCTSNIGAGNAMQMTRSDFTSVERTVMNELQNTLRPELVGRFSEKIVFQRLSYETQRKIGEKVIKDVTGRLKGKGYEVEIEEAVIEYLIRVGIHKTLGARPMRDTVERHVEGALAINLLNGGSGCGKIIVDSAMHGLLFMEREAEPVSTEM
jgi:ATP-dependent Clp protease ATP-binding subunit ClpB